VARSIVPRELALHVACEAVCPVWTTLLIVLVCGARCSDVKSEIMGRARRPVGLIMSPKKRRTAIYKREPTMFKKAEELYENCGVEVTLVTNNNGVYHFFNTSGECMSDVLARYLRVLGVSLESFKAKDVRSEEGDDQEQDQPQDNDDQNGEEVVLSQPMVYENVHVHVPCALQAVLVNEEVQGVVPLEKVDEVVEKGAVEVEAERKEGRRARKAARLVARLAAAERVTMAAAKEESLNKPLGEVTAMQIDADAAILQSAFLGNNAMQIAPRKLSNNVLARDKVADDTSLGKKQNKVGQQLMNLPAGPVDTNQKSTSLGKAEGSLVHPSVDKPCVVAKKAAPAVTHTHYVSGAALVVASAANVLKKRKQSDITTPTTDEAGVHKQGAESTAFDEDLSSWLEGFEKNMEGQQTSNGSATAQSDPVFALFALQTDKTKPR